MTGHRVVKAAAVTGPVGAIADRGKQAEGWKGRTALLTLGDCLIARRSGDVRQAGFHWLASTG